MSLSAYACIYNFTNIFIRFPAVAEQKSTEQDPNAGNSHVAVSSAKVSK